MARQMVRPKINEVSGVNHPAHLTEGWIVMCADDPETAALLAEAEALAKGLPVPSAAPAKETTMPEGATIDLSTLDEGVRKHIEGLEAEKATALSALTKALSGDTAGAVTSQEDLEAATFAKAVENLPPAYRETMLKQQRESAENSRMIKAMHDEREDGRFTAMAKELLHLPGVGPDFGPTVLRKCAEASPDAFEPLLKVLKGADEAIKASGFYKEIGTGHDGNGTGSSDSQLEAVAKELVKADPTLTYADAISKAAQDNPELYSAHRQEELRRNAGVGGDD